MRDFHDEPTIIPDGEMPCLGCSHTDCLDCGREVGRALVVAAQGSTAGLIEFALEVCYQVERYGKNIPGHAFTLGALARLAILGTAERHPRPIDYAWAEGICEALTDTAHVQAKYPTVDESEAYILGVALVARWREGERRARDVGAAKANVDGWAAMGLPSPVTPSEFSPCTLAEKARRCDCYDMGRMPMFGECPHEPAAGSQEPPSTPPASRGQARDAGPGLNSRAQHKAESGNASRGLHSPPTASRRGG
jgi:hypothetical protein